MTNRDVRHLENIDDLRDRLQGEVLGPENEGYDQARSVWNGLIDKYPAAVAQCSGVADVIASVNFARENDLLLAIKSGGHDYAGNSVCDDGLVIDLSQMKGIRVDPRTNTARAEPGVTWREFYRETQPFGLATPGGLNGVGIAGFTLGGGIGYLSRKYGFTVDNLRSADVVTADGELVYTDENHHPDLFWALRGGGGNFGVVTSFEYDLHKTGTEVLVSNSIFPHEQLTHVLKSFREFVPEAPDDFMCYASISQLPEQEPFPPELQGKPALSITAVYADPGDEGQELLTEIRDFGDPIYVNTDRQTLTELADVSDSAIFNADRFYSKSQYLSRLPNEAIKTIEANTSPLPGEATMVALGTLGGAMNRIDTSDTAFPHRDTRFEFSIWPAWSDPLQDDELLGWAQAFHEEMTQYAMDGVYVNLLSHDEQDRIEEAYLDNIDRLRTVKSEWDPANLFRMNQNINPEG